MATQTVTIDTANSPWIHKDGSKTTLSGTSQTFVFGVDDLGATTKFWIQSASGLTLADGGVLDIYADKEMTMTPIMSNSTDMNYLTIFARVDGGTMEEIHVFAMSMSDVDGNNTDLTLKFEYPGLPYVWTWTGLNTTAA